MLATVAQVKARLGIGSADTEHDAVLAAMLANASDLMARDAGRVWDGVARLEYSSLVWLASPAPRTHVLYLPAWPVAAISEIKEAFYEEFSEADALVENTGYQCLDGAGKLIRIGFWLPGDLTVRVTYTGGYTYAAPWSTGSAYAIGDVAGYGGCVYTCSDTLAESATVPPSDTDHWTVAAGQRPVPGELTELAIVQTQHWFQRKGAVGLRSEAVQGASTVYEPIDLLPAVRRALTRYRRRIGG